MYTYSVPCSPRRDWSFRQRGTGCWAPGVVIEHFFHHAFLVFKMTLRAYWRITHMTRVTNSTSGQIDVPSDPNALFTMEQACAFLACSRGTVYNLIKKKLLRPTKILGLTRFRRSDLEALILSASPGTAWDIISSSQRSFFTSQKKHFLGREIWIPPPEELTITLKFSNFLSD